jgi:2-polyprenyl-3-methyl-5-hydroxy-6-metoxy-1,4-benzoquinol methylase
MYDERYYTNNNYASYLERQERYKQLVIELHHDFFPKIGLGNIANESILDFGCAVGFIVKAFKDLSYSNINGFDISEWAIEYGKNNLGLETNITSSFDEVIDKSYKLVLALDVLEHIVAEDLHQILKKLKTEFLIIRIPVSAHDDKRYILDISEKDKTHIIRWTKQTWISMFELYGYIPIIPIQLHNIYDTNGVLCALFRHKNAKIPLKIQT